tara:strand:- start:6959 stop:7825 length:867 start_codon:yes stop_codon:yes gene_type:complete
MRFIQKAIFVGLCVGVLMSTSVQAQQRPLVTEDPEPVGAGRVLLEAGLDYNRDVLFPVSGLTGNLTKFPLIGISFGVGSITEIQIDGGLRNSLSITNRAQAPLSSLVTATGDKTSSVEDIVIGAKVRIAGEGMARPSIGARFATRLPNASNESGIGLDTIDFFSSLLLGKTIQSVRVVGNIGLGILSDPTQGNRQNDVLTYGVSFARALTDTTEIVGEINGRISTREGTPPPGTESRSVLRFGGRYTRGMLRVDAGLLLGLTSMANISNGVGFTTGFTYVFNNSHQLP